MSATTTCTTATKAKINDVPQASWKNVEAMLLYTVGKKITKDDAASVLGNVTKRECDYVVQSLRFLGWVPSTRNVKHSLLELNNDGNLAAQNKTKRLEDAWDLISNWSPAHLLIQGKTEQALVELMQEGLNEVTAKRRLSTIKNWIKALNPDTSLSVATVANNTLLVKATQRYIAGVESIDKALPKLARQLCEGRVSVEDIPEGVDDRVLSKVRKYHHRFASAVRKNYANRCVMSGTKLMTYASHIKPWSASSGVEKTDPDNGLLLDERWDRLFDKGYVSFDDAGKIMLSPSVKKEEWSARNITGDETIKVVMSDKTKEYMQYHREHVYQK